jgi:outer membrane protein assembly factor BamB
VSDLGPEYQPYPPEDATALPAIVPAPLPDGAPVAAPPGLAPVAGLLPVVAPEAAAPATAPPTRRGRKRLVGAIAGLAAAVLALSAAAYWFVLRPTLGDDTVVALDTTQAPDLPTEPRLGEPIVLSKLVQVDYDQLTDMMESAVTWLDATHVAVVTEPFNGGGTLNLIDLDKGKQAWDLDLSEATGLPSAKAVFVHRDGRGGALVGAEDPADGTTGVLVTVDKDGQVTGSRAGAITLWGLGPDGLVLLYEGDQAVVTTLDDLGGEIWHGPSGDGTAFQHALVGPETGLCLIPTQDGYIDPRTGELSPLGANNWPPEFIYYEAAGPGRVFQMDLENEIVTTMVDPATGKELWDRPLLGYPWDVDAGAGVVLMGSWDDQSLSLVDLATGQAKWTYDAGEVHPAGFLGNGDVLIYQPELADDAGEIELDSDLMDLAYSSSLALAPGDLELEFQSARIVLDGATGQPKAKLASIPAYSELIAAMGRSMVYLTGVEEGRLTAYNLADMPGAGDPAASGTGNPAASGSDHQVPDDVWQPAWTMALPERAGWDSAAPAATVQVANGRMFLVEEAYDQTGYLVTDVSFREFLLQ